MPGQVEHVHQAFPHRLALECLAYRNGLDQRRRAAVRVLDGFFELIGFNFGHSAPAGSSKQRTLWLG